MLLEQSWEQYEVSFFCEHQEVADQRSFQSGIWRIQDLFFRLHTLVQIDHLLKHD